MGFKYKDPINLEDDFLEDRLSMQGIAEDSYSYSCDGCKCGGEEPEEPEECPEEPV